MIGEDYVSFETAKLLKDKEFYQDYYSYPVYWMNGNKPILSFEGDNDFPYNQNECVAPSQWAVMKWLREVYYINLNICWNPSIEKYYIETYSPEYLHIATLYKTYEEACEAAIKYVLENIL